MNLLKRDISPILEEAWNAIDAQARRVLSVKLAARKLVDVAGPLGWDFGSVNTGKLRLIEAEPQPGVRAGVREVQPLLELRTPFHLALMELDSVSRGSETPELTPLTAACERMALAEDAIVFHGFAEGGVTGILKASEHAAVPIGGAPEQRFAAVVQAWQTLQHAGVGGPYALAVSSDLHSAILQAADDGYPIIRRIRELLQGPVVRADALEGGALLSTRGGDFRLTLGQDLSIGYVTSDREQAELYITSSFTFQTLDGAAVVCLRPESA